MVKKFKRQLPDRNKIKKLTTSIKNFTTDRFETCTCFLIRPINNKKNIMFIFLISIKFLLIITLGSLIDIIHY